MNGPALTSLVGGRPREGDAVVPDINAAGLAVPVPASDAVRA
jgi:hypothetical protein